MKKFLILSVCFLALTQTATAQCEQPTQLPYIENIDTAIVPALPQCMQTTWSSFASSEVFNSIAGPIEGFEGQVLGYDTTANSQSPVGARLETPLMELQQGVAYTVYFLYGNSDPDLTISSVAIYLSGSNVEIGNIANITGAQPANFISAQFTPPSTGIYSVIIDVDSAGGQGLLYIDDIRVQEVGVMGVNDKIAEGFSLYPNPAKDMVTINYKNEIESVEVYGSTGQLIISEKPNTPQANINISKLSSGVYFLNITSAGLTKQSKILKE